MNEVRVMAGLVPAIPIHMARAVTFIRIAGTQMSEAAPFFERLCRVMTRRVGRLARPRCTGSLRSATRLARAAFCAFNALICWAVRRIVRQGLAPGTECRRRPEAAMRSARAGYRPCAGSSARTRRGSAHGRKRPDVRRPGLQGRFAPSKLSAFVHGVSSRHIARL